MRTALASARFWVATAERAVKTAAQSALLAFGQDVLGFDVFATDWGNVAGFALGGAVLSVLTSLGSITVNDPDSPSLV